MMLRFAFLLLISVSPALAQQAGAGAPPSPIGGLLPLVLIVVVFYFLIIRPQNKKMKEHRALVESVERLDRVVTAGGIHGKVTKVSDDGTIMVEIADGVEVKVEKATLSHVRNKNGEAKKLDGGKPAPVANDNNSKAA